MTTMNVCHVDHKTKKMSNPLITHAYDSSHMQINKQNKGVKTAEVKKQVKKLGVIKPHKGHTLFEIEVKSMSINLPEFEAIEVNWTEGSSKSKLKVKEGCVYISALNKRNALKKFKKGSNGSRI